MAPSAPTPMRQALEQRLSQLSAEMEHLFGEVRDRARRDMADQLNQAVRRIRQANSPGEIGATLIDASGPYADGCALFRVEGGAAHGENIRGVSESAVDAFRGLAIPLAGASALAGAIETRDPVAAAAAPAEISQELIDLAAHPPEERVSVFPIEVRAGVPALLYAWGSVQASALELLAQMASAAWSALPVATPELVTIAAEPAAGSDVAEAPEAEPAALDSAGAGETVAPAAPTASSAPWDRLSVEEQRMHLRAQRFARVHVAQMRLLDGDAVRAGRDRRDLYHALRERIDAVREEFHRNFFTACPSMVDYFHLELVRTLAHDETDLLGKDYPGPLV